MASIKFSIDTRGLEKALKKEMEKAAKQVLLLAEVEAQPDIGGVRMLDKAGEDALRVILKHYDGNEKLCANGSTDAFPPYMHLSLDSVYTSFSRSSAQMKRQRM